MSCTYALGIHTWTCVFSVRCPFLSGCSDTFTLTEIDTLDGFAIDDSNIAWPTDRDVRFSRLNVTMGNLNGTTPPPNWPQDISQVHNGLQNEHNIVWFRASVLPWIRKLYGRIHSNIPPGSYFLNIQYSILTTWLPVVFRV